MCTRFLPLIPFFAVKEKQIFFKHVEMVKVTEK